MLNIIKTFFGKSTDNVSPDNDPINVLMVFEDTSRSLKLMTHFQEIIDDLGWSKVINISPLNLDEKDNVVVNIPTERGVIGGPEVLLSRFSGSALYRGNANLCDLQLVMCGVHETNTFVINGCKSIQLENCKPLQITEMTSLAFLRKLSDDCRSTVTQPRTTIMRNLTCTSLRKAFSSINSTEDQRESSTSGVVTDVDRVVVKPAFGGGSRGVQFIHLKGGKLPDEHFLRKFSLSTSVTERGFMMQSYVGDIDSQIRVEIVNHRLVYFVVIRDTRKKSNTTKDPWSDADNLCLCEVSPDIDLRIFSTWQELSVHLEDLKMTSPDLAASSMQEYAEQLSRHINSPVMALEFKLCRDTGKCYVIDLNLQSNYNYERESYYRSSINNFVRAPERYMEMFIEKGYSKLSGSKKRRITNILSEDSSVRFPTSPDDFDPNVILPFGHTVSSILEEINPTPNIFSTRGFRRGCHVIEACVGKSFSRKNVKIYISPVTFLVKEIS